VSNSYKTTVTWNLRLGYLGNGRFAQYRLPKDPPEFIFKSEASYDQSS
jgi:hypothetical protein